MTSVYVCNGNAIMASMTHVYLLMTRNESLKIQFGEFQILILSELYFWSFFNWKLLNPLTLGIVNCAIHRIIILLHTVLYTKLMIQYIRILCHSSFKSSCRITSKLVRRRKWLWITVFVLLGCDTPQNMYRYVHWN